MKIGILFSSFSKAHTQICASYLCYPEIKNRDSHVLRFNLMRVEIHGLRPEVVTEDCDVLVHYRSRTNV